MRAGIARNATSPSHLLEHALRHFRSKRMRLFEQTFEISARTRILDVGGSAAIWRFLSVEPQLTILNLPSAVEPGLAHAHSVAGDARMLPFRDRSFDIVFSNSVIEHVGDSGQQRRFAEEVSRVGCSYWIQTPNRSFPIELHVMLPFVHHLPKTWQRAIVNRFTVWEVLVRPSEEQRKFYIHHFLNELNLLDAPRLRAMFPDARILTERAFGLGKSLVAVRNISCGAPPDRSRC